jgi:glucose-6-phosphate isomerase
MLFEASIAFLGEYFDINAFDQPGVELSKILTRKKLQ